MLCPACNIAMPIVGGEPRPEQGSDGMVRFVHINTIQCRNSRCSRYGIPQEEKTLLWEGKIDAMSTDDLSKSAIEEVSAANTREPPSEV